MFPGVWELLLILGVVILIFGAKRLPKLGADLGKMTRQLKGEGKDGDEPDEKTG